MASQRCYNGINNIKRVHHSLITYRFSSSSSSSSYLPLKSKPQALFLSSPQLRIHTSSSSSSSDIVLHLLKGFISIHIRKAKQLRH